MRAVNPNNPHHCNQAHEQSFQTLQIPQPISASLLFTQCNNNSGGNDVNCYYLPSPQSQHLDFWNCPRVALQPPGPRSLTNPFLQRSIHLTISFSNTPDPLSTTMATNVTSLSRITNCCFLTRISWPSNQRFCIQLMLFLLNFVQKCP